MTILQSHLLYLIELIIFSVIAFQIFFLSTKYICLSFVLFTNMGFIPIYQNVVIIMPQMERTVKLSSWRAKRSFTYCGRREATAKGKLR